VRAVLDVNVLISVLLSPTGAPAKIFTAWLKGHFDLVVSQRLLDELTRVLGYRRVAGRVDPDEVKQFTGWLAHDAVYVEDPDGPPPMQSGDPDDDYLIALAAAQDVFLVTGDRTLLTLRDRAPVLTAAEFLRLLEGDPSA
jgi:putative PIN family toxin of toxin-antitoxin system